LIPFGGGFEPDHPPKRMYDPIFKKQVEKFKDRVAWSRRFEFDADMPAEKVGVVLNLRFQVCNDVNCILHNKFYQVTLADSTELSSLKAATFQGEPLVDADSPAPPVTADDSLATGGTDDPF